jgi:hypothetical protein
MNAHTLSSRNRPGRSGPRRALALAVLAATAMLAAACGGGPSGATGSTQYQKALAFVRCMRAHGAIGVPDPTSAGTITVTQALLNNPTIQSAAPDCKKLLPPGTVQLPPALQRKMANQALAYAACMRSHGEPNFPDPIIHGDSIGFRVSSQAVGAPAPQSSPGSAGSVKSSTGGASGAPPMPPQFQAAQRACQHFLPGSG